MKLSIAIIIVALFSCKKETERSIQTSFWYCGASTNSVAGDQGISAEANVVKFGGGNFYMKSWWIAFNFTDIDGKPKWTQWGYATHKSFGNITIIDHYDFSIGNFYQPPIVHINTVPLNYGGRSVFTIYRVPNTTKWRYARDGVDIEEVDLKTTAINNFEIKLESQSSTPGQWGQQVLVKNISTLSEGSWVTIPSISYSGSFYASTGLSIWAIAGRNQDQTLQVGELKMGGRGSSVFHSSILW